MDYRQLGRSGLKISALSLGTMTFGGKGNFAKTGATDLAGARRQIDLCIDAGINLFDTADVYSAGLSEQILGEVLEGRRAQVLIATKARFRMGQGPNDAGSSRFHLIEAVEASLKRLRTEHIDLYQLHEWDGETPLEETLEALDTLVRSGKVRYVGISNFSGWHVMKTIAASDLQRLVRPVSQQIHYTLQAPRLPAAFCRASTAAVTSHPTARVNSPTGASLPFTIRRDSTTSSRFSSPLLKPARCRPRRWRSPG